MPLEPVGQPVITGMNASIAATPDPSDAAVSRLGGPTCLAGDIVGTTAREGCWLRQISASGFATLTRRPATPKARPPSRIAANRICTMVGFILMKVSSCNHKVSPPSTRISANSDAAGQTQAERRGHREIRLADLIVVDEQLTNAWRTDAFGDIWLSCYLELEAQSVLHGRLSFGPRLTIMQPPLVMKGPVIEIRARSSKSLEQLADKSAEARMLLASIRKADHPG